MALRGTGGGGVWGLSRDEGSTDGVGGGRHGGGRGRSRRRRVEARGGWMRECSVVRECQQSRAWLPCARCVVME